MHIEQLADWGACGVKQIDVGEMATVRLIYTPEQFQRIATWEDAVGSGLRALRPREWQVLWCLMAGMRNHDIARQMSLSRYTVEKHISSILQKLGVSSRTMLLAYILTHHLDVLRHLTQSENPFLTWTQDATGSGGAVAEK